MADDVPRKLTLIDRLRDSDAAAADELAPELYAELHQIADRLMRGERTGHTLQATALVHEAWVRLAGADVARRADDRHFLRLAARVMRRVLVDHARARAAIKRGGDRLLGRWLLALEENEVDVLGLHDSLARLEEIDPSLAELVELRFFVGLSVEEVAAVLGVSVTTVERCWRTARAWLRRELGLT